MTISNTPIATSGSNPERAGRGACLVLFPARAYALGGGPAGRRGTPSRRLSKGGR